VGSDGGEKSEDTMRIVVVTPKRIAMAVILALLIWGAASVGQFVKDSQKLVVSYHTKQIEGR
jgi:hypothetical protein